MGRRTVRRDARRPGLVALAVVLAAACGPGARSARPAPAAPKEASERPAPELELAVCPVTPRCEPDAGSPPPGPPESRTREVVRRAMRRRATLMRDCYEHHLQSCAGRWSVRFVIRADGTVERAGVIDFDEYGVPSATTNPAFERCLVDAFCAMCFPPIEAGSTTVTYPLHVDCAEGG